MPLSRLRRKAIVNVAISAAVFTGEIVESQSQVLRQSDQLASALLDPHECVDSHGVCRDEIVELQLRRLVRLRTCFEQIGHLRGAKPSSKPHDPPSLLIANLNAAMHVRASRKMRSRDLSHNRGDIAP
jgi:hypothetical protein